MFADGRLCAALPLAASLLLAGGQAMAAPGSDSHAATPTLASEFHAAYPATAPSSSVLLAGVDLKRFAVPGLKESARSEQAAVDGGLVLSLSDAAGVVRALIHVAVLPDSAAARRAMDVELHGVSTQLASAADAGLGDLAWADDDGKGTALVIATQANIAYSVNIVVPSANLPTAAAIATLLRRSMPVGAPAFPAVSVTLPAAIDAKAKGGAPVQVSVPGGHAYHLRAEGGYIARGATGPTVRPLGPGAVTVYATVVDELARVTVTAATTLAK